MTVYELRRYLKDFDAVAEVVFREPSGLWTVDFVRPPLPDETVCSQGDVVLVNIACVDEACITGEVP